MRSFIWPGRALLDAGQRPRRQRFGPAASRARGIWHKRWLAQSTGREYSFAVRRSATTVIEATRSYGKKAHPVRDFFRMFAASGKRLRKLPPMPGSERLRSALELS